MSGADLEQFRKRTRWVYYREGVAYGPFSVDEVFGLIDETVLDHATELMELGSNRRVPLSKVRWFADHLHEFDDERTREMEELDFESTRQRLGRSRGVQFYAVNIALPLVLVFALTLGIFWNRIFKSSDGGDPGAIHIAEEVAREGDGADPAADGDRKAKAAGPEFVEADSPLEAGLEDYALGLTMEQAEPVTSLDHAPLTARAKKLPKVVTVKRPSRTPVHKKSNPGGAAGCGPAAAGSGVTEMDFSDDAEDETAGDGDGLESIVRRRLQPVLRKCAARGSAESELLPDVHARVEIRPTGSLGALQLTVEPAAGFSDIRMCIIAGMAGIRVPPFEGPAIKVSTTN